MALSIKSACLASSLKKAKKYNKQNNKNKFEEITTIKIQHKHGKEVVVYSKKFEQEYDAK